jgi:hypothetical protein
MSFRVRNVCFTSFNSEAAFLTWTEETLPDQVRYLVWQQEEAPETGRRHYQGYMELLRSTRASAIKVLLGDRAAHLEKRMGSAKQAADYCRKEESRVEGTAPVELGNMGGNQGSRTDLGSVAAAIAEGVSVNAIAQEYASTFIKYSKGIRELAFEQSRKRARLWRDIQVLVLWGDAGVGKTRLAHLLADGNLYGLAQPLGSGIWWDGYDAERTILLDDFYGWLKYSYMLRVMDGYELRLPIKGSHTYAQWTRVIITSNQPPEQWYEAFAGTLGEREAEMTPAFARRITQVIHIEENIDFENTVDFIRGQLGINASF